MTTLPKLHTAIEAAALLGTTRQRVGRLAHNLQVGQRLGKSWVFTPDDVDVMRQRKTAPGVPKGVNSHTMTSVVE